MTAPDVGRGATNAPPLENSGRIRPWLVRIGLGPGTISRGIAVRIAALVALIAIILATISTVAVQQILLGQRENQLTTALTTQDRGQSSMGSGAPMARGITMPGLPPGTIVVTSTTSGIRGGQIGDGQVSQITTATADQLLALPTGDRRRVQLDGLGPFLAEKVDRGYEYDVVAIPLSELDQALRKLIILEAILAALAVAAAIALASTLIVRSLRPLQRLTTAATQVSNLELDHGEVSLAVRVPESEEGPSNEVSRVGHAFNHMLNNVEGALDARQRSETKVRQFVADASHELRNPLGSIRGYAELTRLRGETLPSDAAFAMERIESESERMSRLVEDMLLLARLDNAPDLHLEDVDVVEVVINAVSDARVAGVEHVWRLHLPDAPVVTAADRNRLHQAVGNLLTNARKHTPPGTEIDTTVEVRPDAVKGDQVVITVSDNGPGIDPSVRDTVFERFARADTSRAHDAEGSTGLGLAIVAAVMAAHGGAALVDSVPGRTTFRLTLPVRPVPEG